jgi:chaperonin GroEL
VGQPTVHQHFSLGINTIADLLASTLGPLGGRIISSANDGQKTELLDDSSTIVRRIISLGTPQKDVGAMIMRNLIWRVGQRTGDGGATAAILARAIYNEGGRLLAAGVNPMPLSRGVNAATELAVEQLRAQARAVNTEDDLASVALTVTGERDLAMLLGEIGYLLGPDAHVIVEKYVAPYLAREYIAGAHYGAQISSMYFYTQPEHKRAVSVSPAIALVDDALTTAEDVISLMEAAVQKGAKSLVIIANQVSGAALGLLVTNHQAPKEKKKLDILALKLTAVGDPLKWAKSDLALLTGATQLGSVTARIAADAGPDDLGSAQRVEFGNKGVAIVANPGEREAVQVEIAQLRTRIAELPMDDDDRPKLAKRLAGLASGVARLKVGAYSKPERALLADQAERALKVLSAAQHNGVVAGGGAAYCHCIQHIRAAAEAVDRTPEEIMGFKLVADALSAPMRQILHNAGVSAPAVPLYHIEEQGAPATFDALSGQIVDANTAGILDSTDVLILALETAVSGALMALTTDKIVYHREPETSMTP